MSVRAITWALDQRAGSPTAKMVLMVLADHANEDGECWPKIDRIAELSETSRRTVQRHIQELVDKRLLVVEERPRSTGSQGANLYRLPINLEVHPPAVQTSAPTPAEPVENPSEMGCRSDTPSGSGVSSVHVWGDKIDTNGVSPVSPPYKEYEPSVEPSENRNTHTARETVGTVDVENLAAEDETVDPLATLPYLTLASIRGLYGAPGREGTDERVWGDVKDPQERERLIRTAVLRWLGEGHERFQSRFFRRILEAVIQESQSPAGGARASPGRGLAGTYYDDPDWMQESS